MVMGSIMPNFVILLEKKPATENVANILRWVFAVFPTYTVGHSIFAVFSNGNTKLYSSVTNEEAKDNDVLAITNIQNVDLDTLNKDAYFNEFYPPDYNSDSPLRQSYYSKPAEFSFSDGPEGSMYVMVGVFVVCSLIVFLSECGLF